MSYGVHFWRTKSGLEVDFVLGEGEVAVEVQGASRIDDSVDDARSGEQALGRLEAQDLAEALSWSGDA